MDRNRLAILLLLVQGVGAAARSPQERGDPPERTSVARAWSAAQKGNPDAASLIRFGRGASREPRRTQERQRVELIEASDCSRDGAWALVPVGWCASASSLDGVVPCGSGLFDVRRSRFVRFVPSAASEAARQWFVGEILVNGSDDALEIWWGPRLTRRARLDGRFAGTRNGGRTLLFTRNSGEGLQLGALTLGAGPARLLGQVRSDDFGEDDGTLVELAPARGRPFRVIDAVSGNVRFELERVRVSVTEPAGRWLFATQDSDDGKSLRHTLQSAGPGAMESVASGLLAGRVLQAADWRRQRYAVASQNAVELVAGAPLRLVGSVKALGSSSAQVQSLLWAPDGEHVWVSLAQTEGAQKSWLVRLRFADAAVVQVIEDWSPDEVPAGTPWPRVLVNRQVRPARYATLAGDGTLALGAPPPTTTGGATPEETCLLRVGQRAPRMLREVGGVLLPATGNR